MAKAMKCPCGHRACTAWMVDPQAAVQGVRFTEEEATAVADLLNKMKVEVIQKEDLPSDRD